MKHTNHTASEMVEALKEIGTTPGLEKYQPIIKDIVWLVKDHVELVKKLEKHIPLKQEKFGSAVGRLTTEGS